MTWPLRNSRAVTALSPEVAALLRENRGDAVTGGVPAHGVPPLPDAFRAQLLAAYERRGGGPSSTLRLLLGDVRWPAAALSAAAAACLVVFAGAPAGNGRATGAPSGTTPGASSLTGALAARVVDAPRAGAPRAGERELAFVGGEWEHVHPLPSSAAKIRVVDDQNLPLIGVGWTPDLDGP